jgi:hypothetical protein
MNDVMRPQTWKLEKKFSKIEWPGITSGGFLLDRIQKGKEKARHVR